MNLRISLLALLLAWSGALAAPHGVAPVGKEGKPLNFDFEDGSLKDWTATGTAFDRQPVKGDTVAPRRSDMKSNHQGDYWIGTYEVAGDDPQGTLTSVPFKVTHPFASFLVAGGPWDNTRVELVRADSQEVFFKTTGYESETLRPIVVDLQPHLGQEIFIRIVDRQSGHWGHINFDDFRFYAQRPVFPNVLDPATLAKANDAPPSDVVLFAGLSPQEASDKATLPPGFKMHVFAAEPDLVQPIAFALDHRGRVWVAEGLTYPKRKGAPPKEELPAGADRGKPTPARLKDIFGGADRILILEDTNGDHQFDKRTVFLENLNLVSGLEVGFGGIWIGAAPYLLFVPVDDWDNPKPSADPRILLDGWNFTVDTHEVLNTFTWGPDGWLYGCHGVFCPSHVGKPGAPENERQWCDAAVWRYHPTRHTFEIFTEGGSNPWGIDFDEHGQLWAEMCVIPHLWQMIQGARIERQGGQHYCVNAEETARNEKYRDRGSRKPIYPFAYDDIKQHGDHVHWAGNKGPHAANARSDAAGGGHAHAGMMCYLGDSWPAEYRGKLFIGNIHGQRLNMDIPERAGSGFVGRHGKDFLNFNDTWSQTLNQLYDQDGSVYVIDWYDKNQCHHTREDGHDRSNGRIYKIVYNNQKTTRVDLAKLSDADLVGLVTSKNEFSSRHARRVLQERTMNHAVPEAARLKETLRSDTASTEQKLRALWGIHVSGGLDARTAIENLKSPDEWVRAWTIQLAFESQENLERLLHEANEQSLKADPSLNQLAEADPSPLVRRFMASAAQRSRSEDFRAGLMKRLLAHSEDAADHNLPLMYWFVMEPLVADHPTESLNAAIDTKLPKILNFTTRRIATVGTTEARDLLAEKLATLADPAKQIEMLAGWSAALKGQRSVPMPQGWEAIESKLGASSDPEVRALTEALSLTFGSQNALATLRKTLMDESAEMSARRTAMESLLGVKDAGLAPSLRRLLSHASLRGAALRGLATYDDAQTPAAILAVYGSLNPVERRDALNTLVSRAAFAGTLLASVGQGIVPAKDLTADLVRQLRNFKNPELEQAIQKVWGVARDPSADKQKEIEKYKRIYRAGGSQPGDALRGRAVFARACQQCHTLFDTGGKVGPDLTGSNRGELDYVLQNILDPNAVIPNEYRTSNLETQDDRVITGIVKQQDDKAVTVVTANEILIIPRNEIKSLEQSELSMMPEALLTPFTDQEVRDLIYYLSRPGQVPLIATPDTLSSFFNGKDLGGWEGDPDLWKVINGEIVGRSTTGLRHNEFLKSQMILSDFRLILKIKLTPNKENSGVQFRSEKNGDYEMKGYQADAGAGWWGKLYEENGRAILWDKSGEAFVKPEDWNTYEILAVGSKIRTAINGHLCVDFDDPNGAKQGLIGLQAHAGGPLEVRFKDLALELNPKPELTTAK